MIDILDGKVMYQKIEALRLEKGWSIYDLANKAEISPMTIYNWRDRESVPTLYILYAVCNALEVDLIDFLIDGEERVLLSKEESDLVHIWKTLSSDKRKALLEFLKTL